jgi:ADP-heptose:LPS heptosyltransferase
MKYVDEYAGRVFCFLLTLVSRPHREPLGSNDVQDILLIKFWGMGSIILTTPAIKFIRAKYPKAIIHYLSFEVNRDILSLVSEVDRVVSVRLSNPVTFVIDTIRTIFALQKTRFALVYDFEFFTYYSAIITRLIRAKYTVGFYNQKNNRSRLFSETVEFNDHIHTRDNFLALVSDQSNTAAFSSLTAGMATSLTADPELVQLPESLKERGYIVINPNASKMAYERRLPAEYFVKIIDSLARSFSYNIVLTGSAEEIEYVGSIAAQLQNPSGVINLSGKLGVKELVMLISSSACLVTNDSGPLHIASAVNTPVVAFFGPESPVRYGSLSTKQLVFYRGIECSPCMSISNSKTVNCVHPRPICMTGFDIDDLIKKTNEFINNIVV